MKARARSLRQTMTPHEARLWSILRDRRFDGHKFRRQVPIGSYVADFANYSARLIVELDGGQHAENLYDVKRDKELRRRGFRTLRVWNNELTGNRAGVVEAIWQLLQNAPPAPSSGLRPPSPTRGEGQRTEAPVFSPSPLVGEGGRRPDEGATAPATPTNPASTPT